jgi:uncharacterized membrane protein YkvA (DUF1232 family)
MNENKTSIKISLKTLYFALKDENLPVLSRVLIFITLGYALSPVDLIPDFIPVLGYLDDLVIVPFLIGLTIKSIPKEIFEKAKEKAMIEKIELKKNYFAAFLFIIIWIIVAVFILRIVIKIVKWAGKAKFL